MTRYAGPELIQKAVNLKAAGMSEVAVARAMNKARGTVNGWLRAGGVAERSGITPKLETVVEVEPVHKVRVRVPAPSVPGAVTRVLAIGDAHDSPLLEDKSRFRAMGRLAKERGISHVIQIGDFGDFDSVSTHIAAATIEGKLNNPYLKDIDSLNYALDALNEGLGGLNVVRHITLGNHERRVYIYENEHPQTEGMLTNKLERAFKEHGWTITPYGTFHFLAGVGFTHCALNRLGKSYGGKTAERSIALDAVFDIVIGHSHVRGDHRATKIGPQKHVTVLNLGCALPTGYTQKYVYHGQMSGWWYGCCELTIQGGQITGANAIPMDELMRMHG